MLVKCKECKAEISDNASKCPHCGYKPKNAGCLFYILCLAILFIAIQIIGANSKTSTYAPNPAPAKPIDQKQQETLKNLILGYTRIGLLYKVDKISAMPHAYITQKFMALMIDEKRIVLGVVLSYYKNTDPNIELVGIYDAQSGKHLGRFDGYNINID